MFRFARSLALIPVLIAVQSCSDRVDITGPTITDVDVARAAWVANHLSSYIFDVAASSSWVMPTPYYRVTVIGGRVTSATNANGASADDFRMTIDSLWDRVLATRASHQLNFASFDARGVPIEIDYGPWPVDGGVHYSIRNFSWPTL